MKAINRIADPSDSLPNLPPPLPMGLDDNGDAVAAHDLQEAEYYAVYNSSAVTRFRMKLKNAQDPLELTTQRQLAAAIAVLGALLVWKLRPTPTSSSG